MSSAPAGTPPHAPTLTTGARRPAAIAFDVDDTLYDLSWAFHKACDELLGPQVFSERLFQCFRARSDQTYHAHLAGEYDFKEMRVRRVRMALADVGLEVSADLALTLQNRYEEHQHEISLTPTVEAMLDACLAARMPMAIVTNGNAQHQWDKVRWLGLTRWVPRELVVVSGDVGATKPDRAIFDEALRRLGVQAANAWFVGDTWENDIVGSTRAGWHTLWFNRRHYERPAGDVVPDVTAATEEEMAQVVGELLYV